jgi:hypothetical protein
MYSEFADPRETLRYRLLNRGTYVGAPDFCTSGRNRRRLADGGSQGSRSTTGDAIVSNSCHASYDEISSMRSERLRILARIDSATTCDSAKCPNSASRLGTLCLRKGGPIESRPIVKSELELNSVKHAMMALIPKRCLSTTGHCDLSCQTFRGVSNKTVLSGYLSHSGGMRMGDLTQKQFISVPCPTCGVAAGARCLLHSGSPRSEPHVDRRLSAADAIEQKKDRREPGH